MRFGEIDILTADFHVAEGWRLRHGGFAAFCKRRGPGPTRHLSSFFFFPFRSFFCFPNGALILEAQASAFSAQWLRLVLFFTALWCSAEIPPAGCGERESWTVFRARSFILCLVTEPLRCHSNKYGVTVEHKRDKLSVYYIHANGKITKTRLLTVLAC